MTALRLTTMSWKTRENFGLNFLLHLKENYYCTQPTRDVMGDKIAIKSGQGSEHQLLIFKVANSFSQIAVIQFTIVIEIVHIVLQIVLHCN